MSDLLSIRRPSESWDCSTGRVRKLASLTGRGYVGTMPGGWTYMMTNKPRGVLYIGVAARLAVRVDQHRQNKGSVFCRKYGLNMLVLAEPHESIIEAITREKALKAWRREWKIELIERVNPGWADLFDLIVE